MDSEIKGPEPVHRTTLASLMVVHGHDLLRNTDRFTENRPYLCGIPLLLVGAKPLYFCTKKALSSVWGGFLQAMGLRRSPTPAEVDVRAMITNVFGYRFDPGLGPPAPRARGLEEENMMRTADNVVRTLIRAALGAWGGYIIGRHWNIW